MDPSDEEPVSIRGEHFAGLFCRPAEALYTSKALPVQWKIPSGKKNVVERKRRCGILDGFRTGKCNDVNGGKHHRWQK
jgi:hypothetical protein